MTEHERKEHHRPRVWEKKIYGVTEEEMKEHPKIMRGLRLLDRSLRVELLLWMLVLLFIASVYLFGGHRW